MIGQSALAIKCFGIRLALLKLFLEKRESPQGPREDGSPKYIRKGAQLRGDEEEEDQRWKVNRMMQKTLNRTTEKMIPRKPVLPLISIRLSNQIFACQRFHLPYVGLPKYMYVRPSRCTYIDMQFVFLRVVVGWLVSFAVV
eukprot:GHVT01043533.1.p1 GENE.GHVT01043533.1~~GHVT01043533.1.p1  ORF type:complete len:141 (-),score=8.16 GHVT01043533.1:2325-2747(-)